MMRDYRVGVIGGAQTFFASLLARVDPVLSRPLLPDSVMRTHGWRCVVRTGCKRERHGTGIALIPYRETPCWLSIAA